MFGRRRFICLLISVLMIISLSACGKKDTAPKPSDAGQTAGQEQASDKTDAQADSGSKTDNAAGSQTAEPAKLTGKINLIELDDRDPSILRGMRIIGNSVGSEDDINGRKSSLSDVRCIFAMNEWIEFYPDTDPENALQVWVLKHRDDQVYYEDCKFSDSMPGFAACLDLTFPGEGSEDCYWADFYLNPEDHETGYYDFVFTVKGKTIATLLTRFYSEAELSGKSGTELEALMHE